MMYFPQFRVSLVLVTILGKRYSWMVFWLKKKYISTSWKPNLNLKKNEEKHCQDMNIHFSGVTWIQLSKVQTTPFLTIRGSTITGKQQASCSMPRCFQLCPRGASLWELAAIINSSLYPYTALNRRLSVARELNENQHRLWSSRG